MNVRIPSTPWLQRPGALVGAGRGIAVGSAAVLAMLALRAVILVALPHPALIQRSPFSLAYLAVSCASLWGGAVAGVTATALSEIALGLIIQHFDVTPAELVTAIVTEHGVLRPPYREAIRGMFASSKKLA